jgi:hypothetical protein
MYAGLRGSPGPPHIRVRYMCSQLLRDAMRWVHMHNMFISGTDFWRYLDKAYSSVPGSGGSNPLHAIACVHGLIVLMKSKYSWRLAKSSQSGESKRLCNATIRCTLFK